MAKFGAKNYSGFLFESTNDLAAAGGLLSHGEQPDSLPNIALCIIELWKGSANRRLFRNLFELWFVHNTAFKLRTGGTSRN